MPRTNGELVKGVLGEEYGVGDPDLDPYIDAANALIDRVATCATARGKPLTEKEKKLLETWTAAHFYKAVDPDKSSASNMGASRSFTGQFGMYFERDRFGQTALSLDPSGCLKAITSGNRASAAWLGKRRSEQIPYVDRN